MVLHPTVQALLDVAAAPLPQPSLDKIAERAAAIGSRRDGLRGLREGGSQLRLIGQIAGEAFLLAMKAVSRTEPELVFEQLLQRKEFQLTWLPEDLRKGLSVRGAANGAKILVFGGRNGHFSSRGSAPHPAGGHRPPDPRVRP